ncbi:MULTISPECIES: PTS sugar transporter subunit IIA [Clostridia]|uniref:PTS sugar transporter subunit IIA n=1 Tax=Clostridia TaxID=186801 RepID=UPI000EA3B0FE|nr:MULTISPECIES: PTS sugar transporter subunit IIA [Clostridia]NBJ70589.1 PTS sugar transporter subunit IIA [Roseburia sp. 1XD42-34]RKI76589.1 PTS sugar transporter subunit IIA [Clostridium sp. 1xD42-85]
MEGVCSLYKKDLIFKSDAQTQDEVFNEIGTKLLQKGLVNDRFIAAIKNREKEYPTGLDLSPVAKGLSNVAIPHTEAEYCKTKAIAFVKLNDGITFRNMIVPDLDLKVKYLFFIINNEKTNQTNVLSDLMSFITNENNMRYLKKLDNTESIYNFLTNKKGDV